jgi:hypothetical protein
MDPTVELPTTPSGWIRLALTDLERTETDSFDLVDMDTWVSPLQVGTNGRWQKLLGETAGAPCTVCFAGSIMRRTLGAEAGVLDPEDMKEFDPIVASRLRAVDRFRVGDLERGLYKFFGVPMREESATILKIVAALGRTVTVANYKDDPEGFKADMRKLADDLANVGH